MYEIDSILASTFSKYLIKKLGLKMTKKIEQIIQIKYGKSFEDAVTDFKIMEDVLFILFGDGYKGVIIGLLENICALENKSKKKLDNQYRITIKDNVFFNKILDTMQDHDKKMILNNTSPTALDVSEIIRLVNSSPATTIMNKIDELERDGFLVVSQTNNSKPKYLSTISETKVTVDDDGKFSMSVLFTLPLSSSKILHYIPN